MTNWLPGDFIQQIAPWDSGRWHFLLLKRRLLGDNKGPVELITLRENGKIYTELLAASDLVSREAHTDSSDPRFSYYGFIWKILNRE